MEPIAGASGVGSPGARRWRTAAYGALGAIQVGLAVTASTRLEGVALGVALMAVVGAGAALAATLAATGVGGAGVAGRMQAAGSSDLRRWASAARDSVEGLIRVDREGRIEGWNRGAALLLAYESREILGRPLTDLFEAKASAPIEVEWLRESANHDLPQRTHETVWLDAEGRRLHVSLAAWRIQDDDGRRAGLAVGVRDIGDARRREADLQAMYETLRRQAAQRRRELAEKVDALARANADLQKLDQTRTEFVSLVSHQIRAPLTNMRGAVTRLQTDCGIAEPDCLRMFEILHEQADRLDTLVSEVLNASRIEAGGLVLHPEPVSILPVVRQVVEQVGARSAGRPIRVPSKPGMPMVYADRDRVAEILANFLDNADKYTPPDQHLTVDLRADQTELVVSVRDYGPGLAESDLPRVFEKFYRADSSDSQSSYGHGLGLYVCRLLAEAQGGRVWAENHPEGGAVFSLALPVWQETHESFLDPADR